MRLAVDTRVVDERAARADLRAQIARLEARGGRAPSCRGPRLLGLAELAACRDALVAADVHERDARRREADSVERNRILLERALLHPERHRGLRIPLAALGQPGCGVYRVRPRLGLIGRLAGWWEVKLSSGCPLAMRRLGALIATLVLAGPSPALGAARRPAAFSGECQLSGVVSFQPALTNTPQPITQRAHAVGTCTGTFDDRSGRRHLLNAAPVADDAVSEAPAGSCLAGTATGRGTLTFPFGRLHFVMSEDRLAALPLLTLRGARSGSAAIVFMPSASQDPLAALQACAGAGLDAFAIDGRLQTAGRIAG